MAPIHGSAMAGIAPTLYYRWRKDFLETGKKHLAGDTVREATSSEVKGIVGKLTSAICGRPAGGDQGLDAFGTDRTARQDGATSVTWCPLPRAYSKRLMPASTTLLEVGNVAVAHMYGDGLTVPRDSYLHLGLEETRGAQ